MTEIIEEQNIWFPGIYSGREGDYAKIASSLTAPEVVALVQKRAEEDGEWSIETDRVGDNEDKMRKMMKWVSDPRNIKQCVNANPNETVDWICRDLANGSKWLGGGNARD